MIFLFYLVNFIGLSYFLFKKRTFDFFSLTFFSQLIYFIPGFFGTTNYTIDRSIIENVIVDGTYVILILFVVFLLLFTFIYDHSKFSFYDRNKTYKVNSIISEMMIAISLLTLASIILTNGLLFFKLEKIDLMEYVSSNLLLMETTASIAIVVAFLEKKKFILLLGFGILFIDIFIGFRFAFVISLVAILFIYTNNLGKIRLINFWKFGLLMFFLAYFVILIKQFLYGFKFGFSDYSLQQFQTLEFYTNALIHSEPFVIMSILNEVVKNNFTIQLDNILVVLKIFPFMESIFNLETVNYNQLFQPVLFPYVNYGMANSIFAQFFSIGGYLFVIWFIFIYFCILFLGNSYLLYSKYSKSIVVLLFSMQAFYIYRNDLLYQITLEKKYLVIFLIALLLNYLLKNVVIELSKKRVANYEK